MKKGKTSPHSNILTPVEKDSKKFSWVFLNGGIDNVISNETKRMKELRE